MKPLMRQDLENRLRFDYEVVTRMANSVMRLTAYRNGTDLKAGTHPITTEAEAHQARHYRVEYRIKTLAGRGEYMDLTVVHVDLLCNGNYPYSEPACWVLSQPVPWSPHFKSGYPICLGEIWKEAKGNILLGQLLIHIARLLNFDEVARSGGYAGWNASAIAYWKQVLHLQPITPGLAYPVLPSDLTHGAVEVKFQSSPFRPLLPQNTPAVRPTVFRPTVRS
jgi:hypothetical protein